MGNLLIYSATVGNFCIWPRALPRCRLFSNITKSESPSCWYTRPSQTIPALR